MVEGKITVQFASVISSIDAATVCFRATCRLILMRLTNVSSFADVAVVRCIE